MSVAILDNIRVLIEEENGILFVQGKDRDVNLQSVKEVVKYRLDCSEGKLFPMVIDIRNIKSITKEARDFLASKEGCEGVLAAGVLIDSAIGKMLGNFFIRINKPLVPTKLFTNLQNAKEWLHKQIISNS
jgi:hypothetical protein